jgi:hypothetical protein
MSLKIKIHNAYRTVIALCDSELIGKKFTDGNLQLDLKESFYNGEDIDETKVIKLLKDANADDATFNLAGKRAVDAGIKAGIVDKSGIIKIQGIPHALSLL